MDDVDLGTLCTCFCVYSSARHTEDRFGILLIINLKLFLLWWKVTLKRKVAFFVLSPGHKSSASKGRLVQVVCQIKKTNLGIFNVVGDLN